METVKVKCPLCGRRLFDLMPKTPAEGTVVIKCQRCKSTLVLDLPSQRDDSQDDFRSLSLESR